MDLKDFKKEVKSFKCSIKEDAFNVSEDSHENFEINSDNLFIMISVSSNWHELIDKSVDHDVPSYDESYAVLTLEEFDIYDSEGSFIDTTPEIEKELEEYLSDYFKSEFE